ncbi:hypothetical protein [Enhygromyxa salina]|uniref:Lipoprotein n=1 Tax=Enhygromyxa salina TaxID=215803 RepID=A0A2S9YTF1_9BACT|nr:hypothetical protein [Enhygromyxa salina]PRQ08387.1 hypothetical protein ENSA7_20140 [Enhygromyxa salina]
MTRTLIQSLSPFVLVLALTLGLATGCDGLSDDADLDALLDADEPLELGVEQQPQDFAEAEYVCSIDPDAAVSLPEHAAAPCNEWLTDELTVMSSEAQLPTAGCSQWQEHYFVETNISCGGWGGGSCTGTNCCTLARKYVRTCSACPPSVPTSCGGWTYAGTICACG